jgi:hypothetical protein
MTQPEGQIHHAQKPSSDGTCIPAAMILRSRSLAHNTIAANLTAPRPLTRSWIQPIRSIVHTTPLNPRCR